MTVSAAKRLEGLARRCRSARKHLHGREAKAAHKICIVDSDNAQQGDSSTGQVRIVNTDFIVIDPQRLLAVDCFE